MEELELVRFDDLFRRISSGNEMNRRDAQLLLIYLYNGQYQHLLTSTLASPSYTTPSTPPHSYMEPRGTDTTLGIHRQPPRPTRL